MARVLRTIVHIGDGFNLLNAGVVHRLCKLSGQNLTSLAIATAAEARELLQTFILRGYNYAGELVWYSIAPDPSLFLLKGHGYARLHLVIIHSGKHRGS